MSDYRDDERSLGSSERSISNSSKPSKFLQIKLRQLEKIAAEILFNIIEMSAGSVDMDLDRKDVIAEINRNINEITMRSQTNLLSRDKLWIVDSVLDEIYGYGPITSHINDDTVTEVMVNGPKDIYYERGGKIYRSEYTFRDDQHVMHTIDKIIALLVEELMRAHQWLMQDFLMAQELI